MAGQSQTGQCPRSPLTVQSKELGSQQGRGSPLSVPTLPAWLTSLSRSSHLCQHPLYHPVFALGPLFIKVSRRRFLWGLVEAGGVIHLSSQGHHKGHPQLRPEGSALGSALSQSLEGLRSSQWKSLCAGVPAWRSAPPRSQVRSELPGGPAAGAGEGPLRSAPSLSTAPAWAAEARGSGLCAQGSPWPAVLSWFSGCPWTSLLSEQTEVAAFREENY